MPGPDFSAPLIPAVDVLINGSPLSLQAGAHLTRVDVDLDSELLSMFQLEFSASDDGTDGLEWIDDQKLFALGNAVEIKMGYQDKLTKVMTGEITGLEPEFSINRLPRLVVRGYDRRHRLMRGRKPRTFLKQKDSQIASKIASDAGLTAEVKDSQVEHEYILQANQTDLEFLQARARRINYEVFVEDKKLFFRPAIAAGSPVVTLKMMDDILEFHAHLSSVAQVTDVTVRGWDPKQKKAIVGKAKKGSEVSTMGGSKSGAAASGSAFGDAVDLDSISPAATQAEADQLAKAQFNQLVLGYIVGEGICWGRADLKPGSLIEIQGAGKRFSGQYNLVSVSHRFSAQRSFETNFKVRRNAE